MIWALVIELTAGQLKDELVTRKVSSHAESYPLADLLWRY
jgi:hypothetical protein